MSNTPKLALHNPDQPKDSGPKWQKSHLVILQALASRTTNVGLTNEEIDLRCGFRHGHASKRCKELVTLGFVENSGSVRHTSSGRSAIVWRITEAGKTKAKENNNG